MKILRIAVLAFLLACINPLDLSQAVRIHPTAQLIGLWDEITICSGKSGRIEDVQFYIVPGAEDLSSIGLPPNKWGYWQKYGNKIIFPEVHSTDRRVILHEMMHAKLQQGTHPAKYFGEYVVTHFGNDSTRYQYTAGVCGALLP